MSWLLRMTVVGTFVFVVGCGRSTKPPSTDAATGTVTLEIQSGGETQTIDVPGIADGTMLETVMKSVDQIPIEIQGSGTNAFVQSIGAVATSSTEGWIFEVDGKYSTSGVGATALHPPTTITWKYGQFDPE